MLFQKLFQAVKNNFKNLLCGMAVGAANGLFGGGGGMLAVPLLQKTGLDGQKAHATAILVILPVSLFSFLLYAIRGFYDFSVLVPTALGVTFGGLLGAKLLKLLPMKIISLVFAFLQAFAGLWMLFF
ncbi:MAG: TSUP family transporter [Clostridia bacterium]|nr:TSUP family transporter [Clostridia bacterium]